MRYVSTRGAAPALGFDDVLLSGPAVDGGLYVPEAWPRLPPDELSDWAELIYPELLTRVVAPYVDGAFSPAELGRLAAAAYAGFHHPEVAPLVPLGEEEWLLELFWGPTLSFKDYALALVGRLLDEVLARRRRRATVLGATSGDTGSAAIEALRDRSTVEVFILHPHGRISEVQRRQMTTVTSANVHNLAIDGTFDDCQDLVKALFADAACREELGLAAVNSINWARIMAQTAYYVWAALRVGAPRRQVAFAVPTGNFGNAYAGYAAASMGLPVTRLVVGSNRNHGISRFIETGTLAIEEVVPTVTPAMDIQVPSNLERLLFDACDRDGEEVARLMARFRERGELSVAAERMGAVRGLFSATWLDDGAITAAVATAHREHGRLIDPHTAVGVAAGRAQRPAAGVPLVTVGTAHPAKFPDAVEGATGVRPELPDWLSDLLAREERVVVLPNDRTAVESFIRSRAVV